MEESYLLLSNALSTVDVRVNCSRKLVTLAFLLFCFWVSSGALHPSEGISPISAFDPALSFDSIVGKVEIIQSAIRDEVRNSEPSKLTTGRLVQTITPPAPNVVRSNIDPEALRMGKSLSAFELKMISSNLAVRYSRPLSEVSEYVAIAETVSRETRIDTLLLLAIMAIESNFNPMIESKAGGQGLMQVVTKIHKSKFDSYGGIDAAYAPEANIRVGTLILKQCLVIEGSLDGALRYYVGASSASFSDGGFVAKVRNERNLIKRFASL